MTALFWFFMCYGFTSSKITAYLIGKTTVNIILSFSESKQMSKILKQKYMKQGYTMTRINKQSTELFQFFLFRVELQNWIMQIKSQNFDYYILKYTWHDITIVQPYIKFHFSDYDIFSLMHMLVTVR